MRYIRTESGLIIDTQNTYPFMIVDGYIDFNSIGRFKIRRTADTIEDLCDEFVIKGTRVLYLGIPLQSCELKNIPITQIRGAIWTDGGLIYIAKMNNDGEFELL